MTSLLKASESARFTRPVAFPPAGAVDDADDQRLRAAVEEIERLRAELARNQEAAAEAEASARKDGYREGRASAAADDEQRIRILEDALRDASTLWRQRLAGLDTLAPLIARAALAKLFSDPADPGDLVIRAVGRRLALVRDASSRALRVSPLDFADPAALDGLRMGIGTDAIDVIVDPALPAGECILDLRLGHVDLGPQAQWRALADLLDRMADEPTP